ncbi:MAG: AAA family ATPase [Ignavibacteriales bacterium]|nr:AAA family ATPase [Ignavibacteriales bacterium]
MTYICSKCDRSFPTFHLSCPDCGTWNSLKQNAKHFSHEDAHPIALPNIDSFVVPRNKTRIEQLDMLLGDGFVPGSCVLLIGPPGAGKSTLVMQILKKMNVPSLYVTGEESVQQLKLRADRLRINSKCVFLLFETNVNNIVLHVNETSAKVLVIDSIQTMYTDVSDALPGSSTQIRKCAYILRRLAQQQNIVLMIVGQVTKDKKVAGPKLLEHAVDVVLYIEVEEDKHHHRILFTTKNRFGSTVPRCLLYMRKTGLVFSRSDALGTQD